MLLYSITKHCAERKRGKVRTCEQVVCLWETRRAVYHEGRRHTDAEQLNDVGVQQV